VTSILVLIPIKRGTDPAILAHAEALARRAVAGMNYRIVFDDSGDAPPRGGHPFRQESLAAIRQGMIDRYLHGEDWVFWMDSDIIHYPDDLIPRLISLAAGGIAAPLLLLDDGTRQGRATERFWDIGGFVENGHWANSQPPYFRQPGPIYELDSVGSCYVVHADIYRRGARHEVDPKTREFLASGREWTPKAHVEGQAGNPWAFTEHYSVCAFARKLGLPVRAHADLIALHEKPVA
jgi:hypothetical protein